VRPERDRLGLSGVREGASLEAEEFGFEQVCRNRRAVHVDKRPTAARAYPMEHPGHQVLPGAGFALEEDRWKSPTRRRSRDDLTDLLAKSVHHGRLANELAKAIHAAIIRPRWVVGQWLFFTNSPSWTMLSARRT